jgi:hypothetical protein
MAVEVVVLVLVVLLLRTDQREELVKLFLGFLLPMELS